MTPSDALLLLDAARSYTEAEQLELAAQKAEDAAMVLRALAGRDHTEAARLEAHAAFQRVMREGK